MPKKTKKKSKHKTCKKCGVKNKTVKRRVEPYKADLYNEIEMVVWCDSCTEKAAEEI
jgi:hypothetical protein